VPNTQALNLVGVMPKYQQKIAKKFWTQTQILVLMDHFGLKVIDASDCKPVFCPPLFLFILIIKRREEAGPRKLPGRKKEKEN
jgi:hypothetical protein